MSQQHANGPIVRTHNNLQMKPDQLELSNDSSILSLLKTEGDQHETVLFSQKITKLNRRGAAQDRVIMITQRAIYTLKPKKYAKSQRRAVFDNIEMITVSRTSDEFAIHMKFEDDYQFVTAKKLQIVSLLNQQFSQQNSRKLLVITSSQKQLKDIISRNKSNENNQASTERRDLVEQILGLKLSNNNKKKSSLHKVYKKHKIEQMVFEETKQQHDYRSNRSTADHSKDEVKMNELDPSPPQLLQMSTCDNHYLEDDQKESNSAELETDKDISNSNNHNYYNNNNEDQNNQIRTLQMEILRLKAENKQKQERFDTKEANFKNAITDKERRLNELSNKYGGAMEKLKSTQKKLKEFGEKDKKNKKVLIQIRLDLNEKTKQLMQYQKQSNQQIKKFEKEKEEWDRLNDCDENELMNELIKYKGLSKITQNGLIDLNKEVIETKDALDDFVVEYQNEQQDNYKTSGQKNENLETITINVNSIQYHVIKLIKEQQQSNHSKNQTTVSGKKKEKASPFSLKCFSIFE